MTRLDFVWILATGLWLSRFIPDGILHTFTHLYGPWHSYYTWSSAQSIDRSLTEQPVDDRWRKCRICGWVDRDTRYLPWYKRIDPQGRLILHTDANGRDPWSPDYDANNPMRVAR